MFLGSKIAQQRKAKNITQTDLAKDICTQNTISKIEKHNVPPTTKILIKLCKRIDLTLNDVFSDFSRPDSDLDNKLMQIEDDLYNYAPEDQPSIEKRIKSLSNVKMDADQLVQYHFVIAFSKFRQDHYEDAIFECDKVLASTHSDDLNVYTTLAYTIKGDSYKKLDKLNKADYFFNLVDDFMAKQQKDGDEFSYRQIQIIFVCNQLAHYYVLTKNYKRTMDIVKVGIKLNNQINTTHFMHSLFSIAYEAGNGLDLKPDVLQRYQNFANLFEEYNSFSKENKLF
ncbi:helix-turn-helix domain-containing protein [Nicoliella lavandulae]|uniref:Helix-turn-helix transcriptional regulator n=1 Tax=Nicoliella lavandulae TaxID=3082954 RepID=A0ABU8SJA1_9LACO